MNKIIIWIAMLFLVACGNASSTLTGNPTIPTLQQGAAKYAKASFTQTQLENFTVDFNYLDNSCSAAEDFYLGIDQNDFTFMEYLNGFTNQISLQFDSSNGLLEMSTESNGQQYSCTGQLIEYNDELLLGLDCSSYKDENNCSFAMSKSTNEAATSGTEIETIIDSMCTKIVNCWGSQIISTEMCQSGLGFDYTFGYELIDDFGSEAFHQAAVGEKHTTITAQQAIDNGTIIKNSSLFTSCMADIANLACETVTSSCDIESESVCSPEESAFCKPLYNKNLELNCVENFIPDECSGSFSLGN